MFALAALLLAAAPIIEAISDEEDAPGVRASFDVDASAEVVLDLLWDVGRFKTVFPDIQELAVLARPDDHTVEVRFVVDAVVAKPTYTLRRSIDRAAGRIWWVSIAGDIKRIVGSWQVAPAGENRCQVRYQTVVDIGVPGASSIYRNVVMGKVEKVIERVRQVSAAVKPRVSVVPVAEPTLSRPRP